MSARLERWTGAIAGAFRRSGRPRASIGGYGKYPGSKEWVQTWPMDDLPLRSAALVHPAMRHLVRHDDAIDHLFIHQHARGVVYGTMRQSFDAAGRRSAALVLLAGVEGGAPTEPLAWTVFDRLDRLHAVITSFGPEAAVGDVPLAIERARERLQEDLVRVESAPASTSLPPLPAGCEVTPRDVALNGRPLVTALDRVRAGATDGRDACASIRSTWVVGRRGGSVVRVLGRDPEASDRMLFELPEIVRDEEDAA